MVWSYGLVQEGDVIFLCEIYYNDKLKPFGYCYVSNKELNSKELLCMVANDITTQLEFDKIYRVQDFSDKDKGKDKIKSHKK